VDLADFQRLIEATFGSRDRERGVPSSVAWLAEEVGELAQAVRKGSHEDRVHEFADVLAWLASLANQVGVDLTEAADRYANGCPSCTAIPCTCP
jgi:NTP pyrophosphatase (non-canonical NTP hydrolase)